MRKDSGFSLFEVLTVIAILAIVAALAIPSFVNWRGKTQLSRAAQDLYSNFQKAKIEAVRRNTQCTVSFTSTHYLLYVDRNENFTLDAGETVISTTPWSNYGAVRPDASHGGGDGLTFANPADGIAFAPDGLPRNNAGGLGSGSVFIKTQDDKWTSIDVSTSGNIRINGIN